MGEGLRNERNHCSQVYKKKQGKTMVKSMASIPETWAETADAHKSHVGFVVRRCDIVCLPQDLLVEGCRGVKKPDRERKLAGTATARFPKRL